MKLGKDSPVWHFKWYLVFIYVALIGVVLLTVFTGVFETEQLGEIPQVVWLFAAVLLLLTNILILAKAIGILHELRDNAAAIEKITQELEKSRQVLGQLNSSAHLSETAKVIAFRDADTRVLRDAVFDKLQQKDFDLAYEIIDEISHAGYVKLAQQLRVQAQKYQDATDVERMSQLIAHIEKLLDDHQWAKASDQIEQLIRAHPDDEKAIAMQQRLIEKKGERKKVLLHSWDDAVKRQATDRSLEILRELDQYLTPNEGLALQEAARDVFRTKLHNLGVQFSLAISGRQWARALEAGMEIIRDFPNSRMAEEIREKTDALKTKAQQQRQQA